MRPLTLALVLVALSATAFVAPTRAQQDDGARARGLYIGSRPKKASPHPPKPALRPGPEREIAPPAPVGLGFSLYRVIDSTHAVRADPSATFHNGDALRFVLEPSVDGYLYVFLLTGAGAKMIYPDPRLERGDNFVYAHAVAEVPSRRNAKFDVFHITGAPATERVFFVVSRDPLPDVPVGDALVRYCESAACPWSPAVTAWDAIARRAGDGTRVSVQHDAGAVLSQSEDDALRRDLELGASDAQPSVVALNASTEAAVLVHAVSIRHE